jgi:hypothetical protein
MRDRTFAEVRQPEQGDTSTHNLVVAATLTQK